MFLKHSIRSQQHHVFRHCLDDQNAIKWVLMMQGQVADRECVQMRDHVDRLHQTRTQWQHSPTSRQDSLGG